MAAFEPLTINWRVIDEQNPTYFIADIGSNHDGDLTRAVDLIFRAAESGANAVKFQHFLAEEIASDIGFQRLGKHAHQQDWPLSVYETYKKYELNREWTDILARAAKRVGVDFLSTPYDLAAVAHLDAHVPAWKIGSGDFGWMPLIEACLATGKPVLLATGATHFTEIQLLMQALAQRLDRPRQNWPIALMQCNTNYSGDLVNLMHLNLRVLSWLRRQYPGMTVGFSDHTPGHVAVLGAVALGARLIEKHFTDDNARTGPDHAFAMSPADWVEMVSATRTLEAALGDGLKQIAPNEIETRMLQRRGFYLTRDMSAGAIVTPTQVKALRPCLPGSVSAHQPFNFARLRRDKQNGEPLMLEDFE